MDLRKVKKLIELFEESALVEMEISEDKSTIRLSRAGHASVETAQVSAIPRMDITTPKLLEPTAGKYIDGTPIKSPMVGTFFDASSPDAQPYVTVGSKVNPGDVLCIIEAMKTFNQLECEISGVIKAILKSSGDPVEYGELMFLVAPE